MKQKLTPANLGCRREGGKGWRDGRDGRKGWRERMQGRDGGKGCREGMAGAGMAQIKLVTPARTKEDSRM